MTLSPGVFSGILSLQPFSCSPVISVISSQQLPVLHSLISTSRQASNRRGIVHKNLSSSPFISMMLVLKWAFKSSSIETDIQTCVGYSSSLCQLDKKLWGLLLQAFSKGCGVLSVAGCCGWQGALLKPRVLWSWARAARALQQEWKLAHYK